MNDHFLNKGRQQTRERFPLDTRSNIKSDLGGLEVRPCIKRRAFSQGFSIIELIVAVSIFVILTTTFLINYGSFDRRVTIDILAHQIAGWVHDAQVSAMSIKRARNAGGVFPGYGLYFDTTQAGKGKFVFFADLDSDRTYDPLTGTQNCSSTSVECEQEIALLHGNVIKLICGDTPAYFGETPNCASVNSGTPLYKTKTAHIVFARPNPFDATIIGDGGIGHSHVEITIASPKGYQHTITVWITGQVSVR